VRPRSDDGVPAQPAPLESELGDAGPEAATDPRVERLVGVPGTHHPRVLGADQGGVLIGVGPALQATSRQVERAKAISHRCDWRFIGLPSCSSGHLT